jgi:hypothetical protein
MSDKRGSIMSYIVLHNENTHEDFRYDVPTREAQALADLEVTPQSGYTSCACRDCMDVTVSGDTTKPELCTECAEAGCEIFPQGLSDSSVIWECQYDGAYEN